MRKMWDSYFMEIAKLARTRSTCLRRQVGAVLVKEKRVIATGYNGTVSGTKHCDVKGCLRQKLNIPSGQQHEICNAIHAEQNCLLQCAKFGIEANGSTMYVTDKPCYICAKMIAQAGIRRVVFLGDYPDSLTENLFKECGISLEKFSEGDERDE